MATIYRFEDLDAWKIARELTRDVYRITRADEFSRDFGLKNQIRKASVSVMSNIAEGHDRSGTGEFVQFLATAKGSAAEVKSQLYVALDQEYIKENAFAETFGLATETANMIGGLMNYLRRSGIRGSKYKPE